MANKRNEELPLSGEELTAEEKAKLKNKKIAASMKGHINNPNGRPRKRDYQRIFDSEEARRLKAQPMSMLAMHITHRTNKTNIDYENVRECARRGLTCKQIALCNGFSLASYHNWLKSDPKFKEAIEQGRQEGIAVIVNKLYEKAKDGDLSSIIFFLKNRAPEHWRDGRELNVQAALRRTASITEKSEAELLAIVNAGESEQMRITPSPDSVYEEPAIENHKGAVIEEAEYNEITSP